jgi:phosphonate transport system substrate-binding protein
MRLLKSIAVAAGLLAATAGGALADWRKQFPVLKIGGVTTENQGAMITRFKPVADYLGTKLGVKVEVFTASDYAGIVQALSAGQIQIARLGGASYASGWLDSNGGIEPLVLNLEPDGGDGYYSVLIVRKDNPAAKLEDLKGKSLAFPDPNSTSGFLVPQASLKAVNIDPSSFFGRTVFSGSHEASVVGVLKGNFDSAFTWTSPGHAAGQLRIMIDRNMLKLDDIKIVWQSPIIPNPLYAVRKGIPADMRADVLKVFLDMAKDNMAVAEMAAQGKTSGFRETNHDMYKTIVSVAEDQRKNRRK